MEEGKKPGAIPSIFRIIGIFFTSLLTFGGLLYGTKGQVILSACLAILVFILFFVMSEFLERFKLKKRKVIDYKPEIVLGVVFLGIAIFSFVFTNHFLDVDFGRKSQIKTYGTEKIEDIEEMIASFETQVNGIKNEFVANVDKNKESYFIASRSSRKQFRSNLEKALGAMASNGAVSFNKFESGQITETEIKAQIADAVAGQKEVIESRYDLGFIKDNFSTYKGETQGIIDSWHYLKIADAFFTIDSKYQEIEGQIQDKMPQFQYTPGVETKALHLDKPMKSLSSPSSFSTFLIILAVFAILMVCILARYIAAVRPDGTPLGRAGKLDDVSGAIKF